MFPAAHQRDALLPDNSRTRRHPLLGGPADLGPRADRPPRPADGKHPLVDGPADAGPRTDRHVRHLLHSRPAGVRKHGEGRHPSARSLLETDDGHGFGSRKSAGPRSIAEMRDVNPVVDEQAAWSDN